MKEGMLDINSLPDLHPAKFFRECMEGPQSVYNANQRKFLHRAVEFAEQESIAFVKWKEDGNWWSDFEDDEANEYDEIRWSNNSVNPQNITTKELYRLFKGGSL